MRGNTAFNTHGEWTFEYFIILLFYYYQYLIENINLQAWCRPLLLMVTNRRIATSFQTKNRAAGFLDVRNNNAARLHYPNGLCRLDLCSLCTYAAQCIDWWAPNSLARIHVCIGAWLPAMHACVCVCVCEHARVQKLSLSPIVLAVIFIQTVTSTVIAGRTWHRAHR